MAIGAGDAVEKFGSTVALETSGATITDGNIVAAATTLTNSDDVIYGHICFSGTFAANPAAGGAVDVYVENDAYAGGGANTPSATFLHTYAGSIPVDSGATTTKSGIDIGLENFATGNGYTFHLRNSAGQTLNVGWTLDFVPKAIGPA